MGNLNKTITIITLNVNGLYIPTENHRDCQNGFKNQTQLYAAQKKLTLNS